MGLESRYFPDFGGFLVDLGGMLASTIDPKSELTSRGRFSKKLSFSVGKTTIFKDPGVEVGSKNRSKIDQNLKSKMECLLASIFDRFLINFGTQLRPPEPSKSLFFL